MTPLEVVGTFVGIPAAICTVITVTVVMFERSKKRKKPSKRPGAMAGPAVQDNATIESRPAHGSHAGSQQSDAAPDVDDDDNQGAVDNERSSDDN